MQHKMYGEVKVGQYTKNGKLIKVWESQADASRNTGIHHAAISMCCNGKIKTAGGYLWSFI